MTRIVTTTLACPSCGTAFDTQALASMTVGHVTTEFRRLALGTAPEPYQVHMCPHCGLSGWDTVFTRAVDAGTAARVAESLTPLVRDHPVPVWRRYEFAAWVAQWRERPDEEIGYLYLNAAWCRDDSGAEPGIDPPNAYRREAITAYRRALAGDRVAGNQRAELTYLVGELHRRIGEVNSARWWFGLVAELVDPGETGDRLASLAARQRDASKAHLRSARTVGTITDAREGRHALLRDRGRGQGCPGAAVPPGRAELDGPRVLAGAA